MPIDVIGFAVARAEADKRGVGDQEAARIGVIGSVMSNPLMALVVARSMADKAVPATTGGQTQDLPAITLIEPEPPPDPTNSGPTPAELVAHIDEAKTIAQEAKASADQAKTAAEGAGQAVNSLTTKVEDGFKRIEQLIKPSSSSSSSVPMENPNPVQQSTAKGKGTSGDEL